jgi:hypothetical protein
MRRAVLLLLALFAAGCHPAPAPLPPPSPSTAAFPSAVPGPLTAAPFEVRSVILWRDATAAWLSFEADLPKTGGRYDPRARRPPSNAFVVSLDPAHLEVGTWSAEAGKIPRDSAIRDVTLQTVDPRRPREIHLDNRNWRCTLVITAVTMRTASNGLEGTDVAGTISVTFPHASLEGRFIAHDILRDSEVGPGAPPIPR